MKVSVKVLEQNKFFEDINELFCAEFECNYSPEANVTIAKATAAAMEFVMCTFGQFKRVDDCNEATTRVWVIYEQTTYHGKINARELVYFDFKVR